jgi:hypothetical protein
MIDLKSFDPKSLAGEVHHARLARIRAQREGCNIDELIGLMRQSWQASCRLDLALRNQGPDDVLPEEGATVTATR